MQIAIITGGESGIGTATAVRLAEAGADIAITYHSDSAAASIVVERIEALGRRAVSVQCDVGKKDDVAHLFDAAGKFGTPTWLVNSAGLNMSGVMIEEMELARFQRTLSADLVGPFLTCREFVRRAGKGGGRIVNISSIHERARLAPAGSIMIPPRAGCRS